MNNLSFEEFLARFTGSSFVDESAASAAQSCEEMDPEERRWQLEWSRRNIED